METITYTLRQILDKRPTYSRVDPRVGGVVGLGQCRESKRQVAKCSPSFTGPMIELPLGEKLAEAENESGVVQFSSCL